MRLHRVYSRANCLLECKMEYATKNMNGSDNCVPWYLPTAAKGGISIGLKKLGDFLGAYLGAYLGAPWS